MSVARDVVSVGWISKDTGAPSHVVRAVVDGLDEPISRIGPYRAVPVALLPKIRERISRRMEEIRRGRAGRRELVVAGRSSP